MNFVQDPGRVATLSAAIAAGELTASDLVERCLARIAEVEPLVRAWAVVDADGARAQAAALDNEARAGRSRGALHGIPVGVKDVINVAGLPTRANCRAFANQPPPLADATVVAHLRAAGAVILGKTHTTELAFYESVPPTRNPHDLARTPGGSSAGSAAAVAGGMVPLALGTQTAGSVNRPAAYCGIGAFKPSTLAIGGAGVVPLAPSFDTVGAFGASAADAAYLATGYSAAHLRLRGDPTVTGRIVLLDEPSLDRMADAETRAAVSAFAARLQHAGREVVRADSPVSFDDVRALHRTVLLAELGRTHGRVPPDLLAPRIAADIVTGRAIADADYHLALHTLGRMRAAFWAGFGLGDLLLLPAAPAVAPVGMATGDPSFVVPLTALGGPVATLRAGMGGTSGMPVGALLTTHPGDDWLLAGFLLGADPALEL